MQLYLEIRTCDLSIYTMDHSKFILSNLKEESISEYRVYIEIHISRLEGGFK